MKKSLLTVFSIIALGVVNQAQAQPVSVIETVSGSSGAWTLDFNVVNNLPSGNNIYFFGVQTDTSAIVGNPSGFSPYGTWNNSGYGGSSTTYNNVWIDSSEPSFASLDGFQVHSTDVTAPTDVPWFTFAVNQGGTYQGPGCFNCGFNPAFEGTTAAAISTPEPASLVVVGAGLAGLGLVRRRRV